MKNFDTVLETVESMIEDLSETSNMFISSETRENAKKYWNLPENEETLKGDAEDVLRVVHDLSNRYATALQEAKYAKCLLVALKRNITNEKPTLKLF